MNYDETWGQHDFDAACDMRRLLRARGIEPGEHAPLCDVCQSWVATHVQDSYLVCDKPRCQDTLTAEKG